MLHRLPDTTTSTVYVASWPALLNGTAFARDPKGRGLESRPVRFQVTALGKLLTRMCLCHQAEQFGQFGTNLLTKTINILLF